MFSKSLGIGMLCLALCACSDHSVLEDDKEGVLLEQASSSVDTEEILNQDNVPSIHYKQEEDTASFLPKSHRLTVPFASQAPFADWDDPRQQEGCEEMSVIMVHHYLQGSTELTRQQALEELLAFSAWQTEHGYGLDVSVEELAQNVRDLYGYKATVETDVSVESIKRLIANGYPVIVPAAGRDLGNKYFSGEGPWYHMLVVTGYDSKYFYTNDPGTKRGENYKYTHQILLNAIHDWTGAKEEIRTGRKALLYLQV